MPTYTPMMQQYLSIKKNYTDAFVFFRLGDFYELFFEDAKRASQLLEITLTSRDAGQEERIPMCGVPHHSAHGYIERLIHKGYKVAICEQVEDPKMTKGVVKREVVRIITPGTLVEGKSLDEKTNLYVASIDHSNGRYQYAYADLSTGECFASEDFHDPTALIQELNSLSIREVILPSNEEAEVKEMCDLYEMSYTIFDGTPFIEEDDRYEQLPKSLHPTAQMLISYLQQTQKQSIQHLQPFRYIEKSALLKIDAFSKRNLEIHTSIRGNDRNGSLYWLLDETMTAMGGRKLKQWLHHPLANRALIEQRLNTVEIFLENYVIRKELRETLKRVYDLERLVGKLSLNQINGRDLVQLRNSLCAIPDIRALIGQMARGELDQFIELLMVDASLQFILEHAISDEPPLSIKDGDIIRDGYNEKLDELRSAKRNGKQWIAELEQKERTKTGIKNLKIGYNRVFGYFIEVTKSNIHMMNLDGYERKQTLANAERYITQELKEKEALILTAEEQSLQLEYELFYEIREQLKEYQQSLQTLANVVSELDVYMSFAEVSENHQFTKPTFHDDQAIHIKNGRHPVVEKMLNKQAYVPNDCELTAEHNMLLITGPNMSGKSTFMRQVAITIVMAQIGCFVPADEAKLPITDQIFTRIGAADDLAGGQSTFMVEMMESTFALRHATKHSLLLFDEIGRGTSTYDGMALAQAMMEFIHENIQANTLFSTHYHELTELEETLPRLTNVHVSATEENDHIVFLHKVEQGPADKSYGIHVAKLANMPEQVLERAEVLLKQFENDAQPTHSKTSSEQLTFFIEEEKTMAAQDDSIRQQLSQLDLMNTTPLQALQLLMELQQKAKS